MRSKAPKYQRIAWAETTEKMNETTRKTACSMRRTQLLCCPFIPSSFYSKLLGRCRSCCHVGHLAHQRQKGRALALDTHHMQRQRRELGRQFGPQLVCDLAQSL